jgi:glycerol transport system ATP-binding protein
MHDGTVVQIGSPVELFERPQHTFVGHFIGSPGMNVLPCEISDGQAVFGGVVLRTSSSLQSLDSKTLEIGVRPEFVRFDDNGFAVELVKIDDLGRYRIVELRREGYSIKMIADEDDPIPSENPRVSFDPDHTRVYADGWVVG